MIVVCPDDEQRTADSPRLDLDAGERHLAAGTPAVRHELAKNRRALVGRYVIQDKGIQIS